MAIIIHVLGSCPLAISKIRKYLELPSSSHKIREKTAKRPNNSREQHVRGQLSERLKEHSNMKNSSHVVQHNLKSFQYQPTPKTLKFELDQIETLQSRKIIEALYIKLHKQSINVQKGICSPNVILLFCTSWRERSFTERSKSTEPKLNH